MGPGELGVVDMTGYFVRRPAGGGRLEILLASGWWRAGFLLARRLERRTRGAQPDEIARRACRACCEIPVDAPVRTTWHRLAHPQLWLPAWILWPPLAQGAPRWVAGLSEEAVESFARSIGGAVGAELVEEAIAGWEL